MKRTFYSLVALAVMQMAHAALPAISPLDYDLQFGYGVFNFNLHNPSNAPITVSSLAFNYASSNLTFPNWGNFDSDNITVAKSQVAGPVYHYVLTFKPNHLLTLAPGQTASLSQVSLGNPVDPGTGPSPDYQGIFSQITATLDKGNAGSILPENTCQGVTCNDPASGKLLGGYFTDWSVYSGHNNYTLDQIPIHQLNTIFYDLAKVNPGTGGVALFDPWADIGVSQHSIPSFAFLRQEYPYLNVVLSVGGWGSIAYGNYLSGNLSVLFTYYPQEIPILAQNLVNTMLAEGFNGIDIDYEWSAPFQPHLPGGQKPLAMPIPGTPYYQPTPLSQAEADGYAELVVDLRHDLDALPTNLSPTGYKLTVALLAGPDKIDTLNQFKNTKYKSQSDLKIILDHATSVDLMTYDFHGIFDASPQGQTNPDSISNFQSGFSFDPQDPTQNAMLRKYNVVNAVTALEQADPNDPAFPKQKIVIGVPAYARVVRLGAPVVAPSAEQAVGIFNPLASIEQQAQLGSNVSGEFPGDFLYQTMEGGVDPIGSGTVNYRCLMSYPNSNSPDCAYEQNATLQPLPTDLQFFGMQRLPISGQPGFYQATPWAYGATSRVFISFDNAFSAANKAQYVAKNQLGGIMVWELDGDISAQSPTFQKTSLINSIEQVFAASSAKR